MEQNDSKIEIVKRLIKEISARTGKRMMVFIFVFTVLIARGQIDKNSNTGIGTGVGINSFYGVWGIFYTHNLEPFNKRFELNAGTGIKDSYVFGLGTKFRFYDNSKKIETYLSLNYSYQMPGEIRYDANNDLVDYYNTSATQYLHYYLTGRLWLDKFAAIQLNCGYTQNISGSAIVHSSGPNENYGQAKKALDGGILVGFDLIVFLKFKK